VLVEGDEIDTADGGPSTHPGDPGAARARAARIGSAWLPLAGSFRRVRDGATDEHDVTESFEVHLIERPVEARGAFPIE
jgi:hypothetical protein